MSEYNIHDKEMRKADFLRKKFNEAVKKGDENIIRYLNIPFLRRKGDAEDPMCLPIVKEEGNKYMLIGVAVEHCYYEDGYDNPLTYA